MSTAIAKLARLCSDASSMGTATTAASSALRPESRGEMAVRAARKRHDAESAARLYALVRAVHVRILKILPEFGAVLCCDDENPGIVFQLDMQIAKFVVVSRLMCYTLAATDGAPVSAVARAVCAMAPIPSQKAEACEIKASAHEREVSKFFDDYCDAYAAFSRDGNVFLLTHAQLVEMKTKPTYAVYDFTASDERGAFFPDAATHKFARECCAMYAWVKQHSFARVDGKKETLACTQRDLKSYISVTGDEDVVARAASALLDNGILDTDDDGAVFCTATAALVAPFARTGTTVATHAALAKIAACVPDAPRDARHIFVDGDAAVAARLRADLREHRDVVVRDRAHAYTASDVHAAIADSDKKKHALVVWVGSERAAKLRADFSPLKIVPCYYSTGVERAPAMSSGDIRDVISAYYSHRSSKRPWRTAVVVDMNKTSARWPECCAYDGGGLIPNDMRFASVIASHASVYRERRSAAGIIPPRLMYVSRAKYDSKRGRVVTTAKGDDVSALASCWCAEDVMSICGVVSSTTAVTPDELAEFGVAAEFHVLVVVVTPDLSARDVAMLAERARVALWFVLPSPDLCKSAHAVDLRQKWTRAKIEELVECATQR